MKKLLSLAFAALVLASGCNKAADTFVGKEYKLSGTDADVEITLGFAKSENRYFGKSAVNRYFGSYTLDGDKIAFGPAGATMMMGPENQMKAEGEYLRNLNRVNNYKLVGKKLSLNAGEENILVFDEIGEVTEK